MSESNSIPSISPTELNQRLEAGDELLMVDVREAFERDIADLPEHGQLHIPMAEIPGRQSEIPKDRNVVVYCRSGNRSGWATQFLQGQGYEHVLNLEGGVMGWREEIDPSLEEY